MKARPKIVLLGDSLTQLGWDGWAGQLANVYQRRADVVNRGMSGYNTKWFLEYAKSSDVWEQVNVALVIIFFGANDSSDPVLNPRHHVPIYEFKKNLERLVALSEEHYGRSVPIIIVTAPPVVHHQRLAYQKERFGNKATGKLERNMDLSQQYAEGAMEVARKLSRPVLNLWELMQQSQDWESFFVDGLHFSSVGNRFVANAVLSEIKASYPSLRVDPCQLTGNWATVGSACEALVHDGPFHDEIDHMNPTCAFEDHWKKQP